MSRPSLRKCVPLPPLESPERTGKLGIVHPYNDWPCTTCGVDIVATATSFTKQKLCGGPIIVFCAACIQEHVAADQKRAIVYVNATPEEQRSMHARLMLDEYGIRVKKESI